MSFWSGMARGFKDAEAQRNVKDAAKEREDARLKAEAWQNKTFEYGAKRDDILDKRAEDMTRVEQERYKAEQATAEADKVYTRTTAASQVARDEEWKTKGWALTIDQWDATKDNTVQAQENADRIFKQSIAVFDAGEKRYTKESLRADRAEARAIAQNIYAKERDTVGDKVAKANMERRITEFNVSVSQWDKQFGLQEEKFDVDKKYADRSWNLELTKWDATKDSVEQAQENADRIFTQSIAVFDQGNERYTQESLRADRAEARAIANTIYAKERDIVGDEVAELNRNDRLAQFDKQFGLQEKKFEVETKYADRSWNLELDKWDATKGSVKQAQANADRIFDQTIVAFEATTKQYTAQSLRADSAEARAVANAIYQKERDTIGDEAAKANMDRRVLEWDTSVSQWNKQFGLTERKFEVSKEYSERSWNLELDKWDATKDSVKQAQSNADRIFDQSLTVFLENSKRYTIESLRADRTEARAVAEAIYNKERDVIGDSAAAQARTDRLGQFDVQVDQWNKQFGITERAADRADDQLAISRAEQMLALMPAGVAALLGGGTTKTPSDHTTITSEAMQAGSAAFMAPLAEMDEDEQSSAFFPAAANRPGAQATIIGFMEAQAKKGNTVELSDMPKYFSYLGSAPGKGEAAAKEFMESMISGDANLSDKDTFIKGLTAMKNFRATKELFVQTGAPSSLTDQTQQLDMWEKAVEMDGYRALRNLPPEKAVDAQRALAMLETKVDRQEGLDVLAGMGFGRNIAMTGSYMEHPLIGSYYQGEDASSAAITPVAGGGSAGTPVTGGDATSFASWEEATAARADGFSGTATVGGVSYNIAPLAAAEAANSSTPKDPAFLGTGKTDRPALPTDTSIDAMFNGLLDAEGGVDYVAPVEEDRSTTADGFINIEEGIPGLESAVDGFAVAPEGASRAAELRETQALDMVVIELEEMGIEWPTNKEELKYFRDDLVSLVSDYGVDLPDAILAKLVEKAIGTSGVGN